MKTLYGKTYWELRGECVKWITCSQVILNPSLQTQTYFSELSID